LDKNKKEYDMEIDQEILKRVSAYVGRPAETIKGHDNFTSDLGLDSLDKVEIVMELEEVFNIEIPDDEAEKCHNVNDAVNLVKSKLNR
jgi:acyl carrier protein